MVTGRTTLDNRLATPSRTSGSTPEEADTEVVANPERAQGRAVRRRFSAEYKLRILQEADGCSNGEIGALLRREGLYSSHLTTWRRKREAGQLMELGPKKRGPKPDPQAEEMKRLRHENERLQVRLRQAEAIIDAQKKIAQLFSLNASSENSESE
jgi:transposase